MYTLVTSEEKWEESGFLINPDVRLSVLTSKPEGKEGNGKTSCTLYRKGDNYDEVITKFNTDFGNFISNDHMERFNNGFCQPVEMNYQQFEEETNRKNNNLNNNEMKREEDSDKNEIF